MILGGVSQLALITLLSYPLRPFGGPLRGGYGLQLGQGRKCSHEGLGDKIRVLIPLCTCHSKRTRWSLVLYINELILNLDYLMVSSRPTGTLQRSHGTKTWILSPDASLEPSLPQPKCFHPDHGEQRNAANDHDSTSHPIWQDVLLALPKTLEKQRVNG